MRHEEVELVGGNSTVVTKIGQTVRRSAGPWTPGVHALLATLRSRGITEVPEALGMDAQGREVLSFIPGNAPLYPLPGWIWDGSILQASGALLRRIHDASVGFGGAEHGWQLPAHEPAEVVCHNDFAPYNMVFRGRQLAGIIDFDTASPGPRIWDFAYLAYQLVPFVEGVGLAAPDEAQRPARLDALIAAYGMPFGRKKVYETVAARLAELAEFTDGRAAVTGRADFTDHAAMYRRDRDKMAALALDAP
jgi:Phosphotransferase enzyme family